MRCTDAPSEALAFSNKTDVSNKRSQKLEQSPSKIMRFSAFFVGAAGPNSFTGSIEGIAVDTLLVGCGWITHDVNPNEVWKFRIKSRYQNQVWAKRHDLNPNEVWKMWLTTSNFLLSLSNPPESKDTFETNSLIPN